MLHNYVYNLFVENRQHLIADCEKLAQFELTREDFLKEGAEQVDSTTDIDSPAKPKVHSKKKTNKLAKALAAKERFKSILANRATLSSSESDDETDSQAALLLEVQELRRKLTERERCKLTHNSYLA